MEDGELIAEKDTNMQTYAPTTPLEEVPENLRGLAEILWTPEIIADYQSRFPELVEEEPPAEPA